MRVALYLVLFALLAGPAMARKTFARKEGVKCAECHENPAGGGARNLVGLYYQATGELPASRSEDDERKRMQRVVDEWLVKLAHTPPHIRWQYTPLDQLVDVEAAEKEPASEAAILRRMSLDLRGAPPRRLDLEKLEKGRATLDELLEEYLVSEDFNRTFRLYHADIVRPRGGIFNKNASLSMAAQSQGAWSSSRLKSERLDGSCNPQNVVEMEAYWDRAEGKKVKVCKRSANTARFMGEGDQRVDCSTERGQESGQCGCGPNLVYCYRYIDRSKPKEAMLQEAPRLAMEVVANDLPYGEILTADWTMTNGRLEHFYARLDGTLADLKDADVDRDWQRVQVGGEHSGIPTMHSYLSFFYNGRRWAQRTFEAFLCHETVPDYEFLDEMKDEAPPVAYRRHPLAATDINVNSGRACAACHLQLDGLSRIKDRWDNFGQFYGAGQDGRPIPATALFMDKPVDGVKGFAAALAVSDVFADCVANQAWEHMMGHPFRAEETARRRALVAAFKASNQNFKHLLRNIVRSPEYRAKDSLKLMERELYWRTMERISDVKWTVGSRKRRGFDVFYDKVGGMDYRKIEERDRSPSQGHSLVLFKAATETCNEAIDRDTKREQPKRKLLRSIANLAVSPSDRLLRDVLKDWNRAFLARPWEEVDAVDTELLIALYREVEAVHGTVNGYKALCSGFLGAEDFSLY